MNPRLLRAQHLARELAHEIQTLAGEATGAAAAVFLDRLARLEAFPPEELHAAGLSDLVKQAQAARTTELVVLSEQAGATLDLEGLLERGYGLIARGELPDDHALDFAWDLLLTATVQPYLSGEPAKRAAEVIEQSCALARSQPTVFLPGARAAADRRILEHPRRILRREQVAQVLAALAELPELEELDEGSRSAEASPRAREILERALSRAGPTSGDLAPGGPRSAVAEPASPWRTVGKRPGANVAALFAGARRAGGMQLAASSQLSVPEHVLLARLSGGELLACRRGGETFVEWYGAGTPDASVGEGTQTVRLSPVERQGGTAFRLPAAPGVESFAVAFSVGTERLELELQTSGEAGLPRALTEEHHRAELMQLTDRIPFAPVSVRARLQELAANPHATVLVRRAAEDLARLAETASTAAPATGGVSCAFPVVSDDDHTWRRGAVLRAVVRAGSTCVARIEEAFPEEEAACELLGSLASQAGVSPLQVAPSPLFETARSLPLTGNSFGGAFALAIEAMRRGAEVPEDVVVSAALGVAADGSFLLVGVGDCDRKRRLLELERPGCRFLYVASDNEVVRPSTLIRLEPLPAGPVATLYDSVLAPALASGEQLSEKLALAGKRFENQRYDDAWTLYSQLDAELRAVTNSPAVGWRVEVLGRLGQIEMHRGHPSEALRLLRNAVTLAVETRDLQQTLAAELQAGIAGTLIDLFRPSEALEILRKLEPVWTRRFEDEPTIERRMTLVAVLGALRRVHLLQGEVDAAVEVQSRLLGVCPPIERARSLGDLADALRRAGRPTEAKAALSQAHAELQAMFTGTYRQNTEAFLLYHEGRLALDLGEEGPSLDRLRELRAACVLPAAKWRLEQLEHLLCVRQGDASALDKLAAQVDAAKGSSLPWYMSLGLLVAARIRPDLATHARVLAAKRIRQHAGLVEGMPALAAAAEILAASIEAGRSHPNAEQDVLRVAAY